MCNSKRSPVHNSGSFPPASTDDETNKKALIAENSYDELGNLKTKKLGRKRTPNNPSSTPPVYTNTPIELLDYSYNIRGWMKVINAAYSRPELNGGNVPTRWFGMELQYDWGSGTNSMNAYNGNISGINELPILFRTNRCTGRWRKNPLPVFAKR